MRGHWSNWGATHDPAGQLLPSQPSINVKEHDLDEATGPTGGDPRVNYLPGRPSTYNATSASRTR